MPRSLAAAQTIPIRGDVPANIAQHLQLAQRAAEAQANVLVFPELSLTGYELDLASDLAFSENDPRLTPLVEFAATHRLTMIVGAPVRIATHLHIAAFIISPDRSPDRKPTIHTKGLLGAFSPDVNPGGAIPPAEDTVFEPGDLRPLVQLGSNTAAVGICAESLRSSHPREAAARGATTYLTGHFGISSDLALRMQILSGHAAKHRVTVVFANHGGPSGGLAASGGSAIWSNSGELLVQLQGPGLGLAIAREREDHTGWQTQALMLEPPSNS
jgi:predicted amidohydrolase